MAQTIVGPGGDAKLSSTLLNICIAVISVPPPFMITLFLNFVKFLLIL